MKVAVVGTGYVGLVTGTCLAEMGHFVTCNDIDESKVARLREHDVPFFEPGLSELLRRNAEARRLQFTSNLSEALQGAEILFIAVGTPPDEDGSADLKHVLAVAEGIGDACDGDLLVVIKSTVPVGTCDRVNEVIQTQLQQRKVPHQVEVASNPEFLKEGNAVQDCMKPNRVIIGTASDEAMEKLHKLYRSFIRNGRPVLSMSVRSAEMTKYAANAMLATRISLMNELAVLCDELGADIDRVRRGIGLDPRIGNQFLYAGHGFGGSCFPKDVRALSHLAKSVGKSAHILDAVETVNNNQKHILLHHMRERLGDDLKGMSVAVWGLSFKPDTDDIREAPALTIVEELLKEDCAISAFDPEAMENAKRHFGSRDGLRFANSAYDALEGTGALVIATEWRAFRNPDFEKLKSLMINPIVFDGRNLFEPEEMREAGVEYYCVGRQAA